MALRLMDDAPLPLCRATESQRESVPRFDPFIHNPLVEGENGGSLLRTFERGCVRMMVHLRLPDTTAATVRK